jgi:hypothetical protein
VKRRDEDWRRQWNKGGETVREAVSVVREAVSTHAHKRLLYPTETALSQWSAAIGAQ